MFAVSTESIGHLYRAFNSILEANTLESQEFTNGYNSNMEALTEELSGHRKEHKKGALDDSYMIVIEQTYGQVIKKLTREYGLALQALSWEMQQLQVVGRVLRKGIEMDRDDFDFCVSVLQPVRN